MTPARDRAGAVAPVSEILGVPIHMTTLDQALALAEDMILANRPGYFCHCDAHVVLAARDDPAVLAALRGATMACPDGMPLVLIGRRRGHAVGRAYGPDFMAGLIARTARWTHRPCRHFLFGATEAVLIRLAAALRRRDPGMVLAGMLAPPFGAWDARAEAAHVRAINASRADVVWIGLGGPRQEVWMHRNRPLLRAPVLSGVGAAFDFLSGNKPQAPRPLRRWGLEWAFRLLTEPSRLGRRYVRVVPRFLALAAREEWRRSR